MPSKVQIDVVADVRKAKDNLGSLDAKVGKLGDQFTTLRGRAGLAMKDLAIGSGIQLAGKFGGDVLGAIGDIDRLEFTVTEAFGASGPMRSKLGEWSDDWSAKFGLSKLRTEELAASLALQFDQAGFSGDKMLEMAKKTAEAGLAMSLFRKQISTPQQGAELITAALRGEKDALFNLIGDLELTGEAGADLDIIIGALSEDFGFMTSEAAKNQLKINEVKARYGELVDEVAAKLIPALELVIPAMDGIALAIRGLVKAEQVFLFPLIKTIQFIKSSWDDVAGAVENVTNKIKSIPNPAGFIGGLAGGIGNAGKGLLGKIGIGATGGIVTQPTLAVIGEAGPEAVVPLSSMPGASPLSGGGQAQPIQLFLDSRMVWEALIDSANNSGGVALKIRNAR